MTYAQWMFEYHALQEKERGWAKQIAEVVKGFARSLREMLIGVLGLNLIREWKAPKDKPFDTDTKAALADVTPFVPASILFGRPQVLQAYLDDLKKTEKEERASEAFRAQQDAAFEAFSAALARGETPPDMDPVLMGRPGDTLNLYWRSEDAQAALRSLGVKPRPADAPAVPHVSAKPRRLPAHVAPKAKVTFDDESDLGAEESLAIKMERGSF